MTSGTTPYPEEETRTTFARNSPKPGHDVDEASSMAILSKSPVAYSRRLRNRIPRGERSSDIASSNHGTFSGRTRMGMASDRREHCRRPGDRPPPFPLVAEAEIAVDALHAVSQAIDDRLFRPFDLLARGAH